MLWHRWRTRKLFSRAALIVALVISVGGATARATSAAGPFVRAAASGGTLVGGFDVGPSGSPGKFNPLTDGAGYTWLMKYYSPLLTYDATFRKLQGELATSWDVSPDGLRYTFHLRKGVTWHDSQPFTSKDVQFTINLVKNPDRVVPH